MTTKSYFKCTNKTWSLQLSFKNNIVFGGWQSFSNLAPATEKVKISNVHWTFIMYQKLCYALFRYPHMTVTHTQKFLCGSMLIIINILQVRKQTQSGEH